MRKRERLKRFARSSQSWRQRKLRSGALRWIVTSFLIGTTCLSALEIKNDLEATNVAGSERMMAMRMLKDYMLIALKAGYGNPKKDLPQTMKRFESVQSALHAYVKDPATAEHLKEVDQMWIEVKKMLKSSPKSEDAAKYFDTLNALKNKADQTVTMLVKQSKHKNSKAIDVAGGLRALSQEMAALYMMKTSKVDESSDLMKKPMERFRSSLDFLNKASKGDTEAQKLLKDLEKVYLYFSVMEESGTFTPSLVEKRTENMLKKADELTRHFIAKSNQKGGM